MADKAKSKPSWRRFSGSHSQAAALLVFAMLLAPVLALILTTQGEVVEASPDDNFGYDGIGGSTQEYKDRITGSVFTIAEDGTADNITVYMTSEDMDVKCAIYNHDDNTLVTNGVTEEKTDYMNPSFPDPDWVTFNFEGTKPNLTADTEHVLVIWGGAPAALEHAVYYTDGDDSIQGHYDSEAYDGFPATASFTHEDRKYSIYCSYTPIKPTQPTLSLPENSTSTFDNIPYFEWENGTNAENHRLLIDNDSNFSSPKENRIISNDNTYAIPEENALPPDNYWWKVVAIRGSDENESNTWTFLIKEMPPITWTYDFDDDNYWEGEAYGRKGGVNLELDNFPPSTTTFSGLTYAVSESNLINSDNVWDTMSEEMVDDWTVTYHRFEILEDNIDVIEVMFEAHSNNYIEFYIWDNANLEWELIENKSTGENDYTFELMLEKDIENYLDGSNRFWMMAGTFEENLYVDYSACIVRGGFDNRAPIITFQYAGKDNVNWVHSVHMPDNHMEVRILVYDHSTIENVVLEWYDNGAWENIKMDDNITGLTDNSYYYFENVLNLENERDYSFNIWTKDNEGNENKQYEWLRWDNTATRVRKYIRANYAITDNLQYTPFYLWQACYPSACYTLNCLDHEQAPDGSVNDTGYLLKSIPTTLQERYCRAFLGFWMNENMTIEPDTGVDNIYVHIWWATDDNIGTMAYGKYDGTIMLGGITDSYIISEENAVYGPELKVGVQPGHYLEANFWDVTNLTYNSNDIYQLQVGDPTTDMDNPDWVCSREYGSYIILNVPDNSTLQGMDSDSDGWSDWKELYENYTNPFLSDTDADNRIDSEDPYPLTPLKIHGLKVENVDNIEVVVVERENEFRFRIDIFNFEGLSKIDEVNLRVYLNSLNYDDTDAEENHYSFQFLRVENEFKEIGPDNTSPYDHLIVENCAAGDNTKNRDNHIFAIKLSENASKGVWSVWVEVIDNFDDEENREFLNKFSVSPPPVVENLYITDMDNIAIDNLIPQIQYKFWVEIQDNETLADIENVTLVVYLDNENLPDTEENHYTFRWTRDGGFEEVGPGGVGGSGFNFFTNSIDVTPAIGGSWQDVDVSSHIPSGSTGVLLDIRNTHSSELQVDVRKNSSAYDDYDNGDIEEDRHRYAITAVDSNRIFEAKIENSSIEIWLIGYSDSAVTFLDTRVDVSTATTGSWVDVDVSDNIPSNATGIIAKFISSPLGYNAGVRKKGSTDNRKIHLCSDEWAFVAIGVDDAQTFQQWIQNASVDLYLLGYTISPITFKTNGIEFTVTEVDTWEEKDLTSDTSSNATGAIWEFGWGTWSPNASIRKKGSTDNRPDKIYGNFGYVGLDENQKCELYCSNYYNFYLIGYCENSSTSSHLILENCVAGDNTKTIDNIVFAIEFGEDATVTGSDNWDVWIQVYDNAGNQDNGFFLNRFDIVSGAQEYSRSVTQGFSLTELAPRGAEFGRVIEQGFSIGTAVAIVTEICRLLSQAFGITASVGVTFGWGKSLTQDFSLDGEVEANAEYSRSISQTFSISDSVSTIKEVAFAVSQDFSLTGGVSANMERLGSIDQTFSFDATVGIAIQKPEIEIDIPQGFALAGAVTAKGKYGKSLAQGFSLDGSVEANRELSRSIAQDFSLTKSVAAGKEIAIDLSDAFSFSATATGPVGFVRDLGESLSFTATLEKSYECSRNLSGDFSLDATVDVAVQRIAREYERGVAQGFSFEGTIIAHEYGDIYITSPWCDNRANPIDVVVDPTFSAIYTVADNNIPNPAQFIQIQVGTSWNGNDLWDNIAAVTVENGQRSPNVSYDGMPLTLNSTYWWRCRFGDSNGNLTEWTSPQTFGYQEAPFDLVAAAMFIFPIVLMVIAFAFDNVVFASFAGIVFILSGLFFVDVIWLAMIFVGVGVYLLLAAFLSEED